MVYGDFLKNISNKVNSLFTEIHANYNFDHGDEFEIALCKLFRIVLPSKYGVCRGFVVGRDGQIKGDDIIIYDQERFPTLRLLEDNTFAQKQEIPIEAVYAYIEAKNTLCLEGNGSQSLNKAFDQITAIKQIEREKVPVSRINHLVQIESFNPNRPKFWPQYLNPIFTCIISNNVRINEASPIVPINEFYTLLDHKCYSRSLSEEFPDLIIAGKDCVVLPGVNEQIESPFYVKGFSHLKPIHCPNLSFSAGLTNMLYAFDHILLGNIHWPTVLSSSLGIPITYGNE